jgi:hypothetical protein
MHSWREDTETAIGQQIKHLTLVDDTSRSSRCQSPGIDTPTTLDAPQQDVVVDTTGTSDENSASGLETQEDPSAPGKAIDKNPFGLKPEYKTALRDFFVSLSRYDSLVPVQY